MTTTKNLMEFFGQKWWLGRLGRIGLFMMMVRMTDENRSIDRTLHPDFIRIVAQFYFVVSTACPLSMHAEYGDGTHIYIKRKQTIN